MMEALSIVLGFALALMLAWLIWSQIRQLTEVGRTVISTSKHDTEYLTKAIDHLIGALEKSKNEEKPKREISLTDDGELTEDFEDERNESP